MRNGAGGDVAIIGAGLIGLAIAFELAERGATVRVFDRGEPGRAASWAGAGMLAPYTEDIADGELLGLCVQSLATYEAFAKRVREASGVDPKLDLGGILNVAFDDATHQRLAKQAEALRLDKIPHTLLDRLQTLECEPSLASGVLGALLVPGEGYVDNRRLGRALTAACEARGVLIARDSEVSVECDARRVRGVRTARGFSSASVVINAAGAWAANVSGIPAVAAPPVEPVKGQMLALAVPKHFVRRTTWVPGAYLVPRDDGRLLIGATVEHNQFDTRVTAHGIHALLHAALLAAPALCDFTISETWAGLRPGTPDERPFLGPTPIEGLVLATGHYRNGILLAPVTAELIARFVETGDTSELKPFLISPARSAVLSERSESKGQDDKV